MSLHVLDLLLTPLVKHWSRNSTPNTISSYNHHSKYPEETSIGTT